MSAKLQITLVKSLIGCPKKHKDVVKGLGLTKVNMTVERIDSPEVRGMISKINHMLRVA